MRKMELKTWRMRDKSGNYVEPRVIEHTNNKVNQDTISNDMLELLKKDGFSGLIAGVGCGKSGIALNVATHFPQTVICVGKKNLQMQYNDDYANNGATFKYEFIRDDNSPLKICTLYGRNHFECTQFETIIKANNSRCLCICPVGSSTRRDIASNCFVWSPTIPTEFLINEDGVYNQYLEDVTPIIYNNCYGRQMEFYYREGCAYYDQQYDSLVSDVVIINSAKLMVDITSWGKLNKKDLLIVDEFDEFLDNLQNEFKFYIYSKEDTEENRRHNVWAELRELERNNEEVIFVDFEEKISEIYEYIKTLNNEEIYNLKDCEELKTFFNFINRYDVDNINFVNSLKQKVPLFLDFIECVSFRVNKHQNFDTKTIYYSLDFVINKPSIVFDRIRKLFPNILIMSGTIHNEKLLREYIGLPDNMIKNIKRYGAEIFYQGVSIITSPTGGEFEATNKNLKTMIEPFREMNMRMVNIAKKKNLQTLYHIINKNELAQELKDEFYKYTNSQERLKDFKDKKIQLMVTTTDARGTDLPDGMCDFIIIQKMPNINVMSLFAEVFKSQNSSLFWEYFRDKSERTTVQMIARGLRHKDDKCLVWSGDTRLTDFLVKYLRELRQQYG